MTGKKGLIVESLVKMLEKGIDRGKALSKTVKEWQMSDRTFDRHWKNANHIYKELQKKASKAADEAYIKSKENAAIEAVMSSQERKEVLTKIARGQVTVLMNAEDPKNPPVETLIIVATFERLKAIAELNKMEGDYAPTKTALTNVLGEDILPIIGMTIK